MKLAKLRAIPTLCLTVDDVARALSSRPASARVFCARAVKSGELLRLKRNRYMLRERWAHLASEERWQVANLLQVPSYVSLMTALGHYELTTQLQPDYIESVAIYRTQERSVGNTLFRYAKVAAPLYFGFVKQESYFIATPEKALLDCLYLASLQRYHLDWQDLDLGRVKRPLVQRLLTRYPARTRRLWKQVWTTS